MTAKGTTITFSHVTNSVRPKATLKGIAQYRCNLLFPSQVSMHPRGT